MSHDSYVRTLRTWKWEKWNIWIVFREARSRESTAAPAAACGWLHHIARVWQTKRNCVVSYEKEPYQPGWLLLQVRLWAKSAIVLAIAGAVFFVSSGSFETMSQTHPATDKQKLCEFSKFKLCQSSQIFLSRNSSCAGLISIHNFNTPKNRVELAQIEFEAVKTRWNYLFNTPNTRKTWFPGENRGEASQGWKGKVCVCVCVCMCVCMCMYKCLAQFEKNVKKTRNNRGWEQVACGG